MTKEEFIVLLSGLVGDIVNDTKNPRRIPKYRVKDETKAVKTLAKAVGIGDLNEAEVDAILGWD